MKLLYSTENECETDNGGCEHLCKDTLFSYKCSCRDGYTLNQDNHTCSGKISLHFPTNLKSYSPVFTQILMNALLVDMNVMKYVKTLRGHTCVVVKKAIL